MFIDEVDIKVISGKGGDGLVSWRREKYIPKGGPRGGDGGDGGSVFIKSNPNINTLSEYRHKKLLKAGNGVGGGTQNMHGANGDDIVLEVPVGTIVTNSDTGVQIIDLDHEDEIVLIAEGGRGGYGNSHFCSSTRQAPAFAELGDVSTEVNLHLELKLTADIGIIGIPSAGKSTLIGNITNVKPKIGDYPFTTLVPNLGVLDHKGKSLVLEDVPGLIPGASEGKGLGITFLKHIERCGALLHLLDLSRLDKVFDDYSDIRKELGFFSESIFNKDEIVVFSKSDLLDTDMATYIVNEFKYRFKVKDIFILSSATRKGVDTLVDFLIDNYTGKTLLQKDYSGDDSIKMYNLKSQKVLSKNWDINYIEDLTFRVSGERIEQIVRMTDFDNLEGVMRVYDVLDKVGIIRKVEDLLKKHMEKNGLTNDFYFEGNEEEEVYPKLLIGDKVLNLEKLKFNL